MRRYVLPLVTALLLAVPALADGKAAELVARFDSIYSQRVQPEVSKELETLCTSALRDHANDPEVLWRVARYRYWRSDDPKIDSRLKRQLGKEVWNLGEQLTRLDPKRVEGHYAIALGIAAYSQAVGILRAIGEGLEGKFNQALDQAIKIDAKFDAGGPWITRGRAYFELPWPKRDLEQSKTFLEKAAGAFPHNLRAHLYLAETLLRDGEPKAAKQHITQVLNGKTDYDPAEGENIKSLAKAVAQQIEEELQ
jgi:tetratricopeptide (TPR) repeat protein